MHRGSRESNIETAGTQLKTMNARPSIYTTSCSQARVQGRGYVVGLELLSVSSSKWEGIKSVCLLKC